MGGKEDIREVNLLAERGIRSVGVHVVTEVVGETDDVQKDEVN